MSRTPAHPDPRGRLLAAACAGMFIFGAVLALLGTLFGLPVMRARLHINLVQQGDLLLMLFGGVWLITMVAGPLIDRFGNQPILSLCAAISTVALLGIASAQSFAAAGAAAVLLGIGGGGLNIAANVLVSDLYGDERGPMLNYLGTFFGVGALFVPFLTASLARVPPHRLILAPAALAAVCAAAYVLLPFPQRLQTQAFSWREAAQVVRYPGVLLFALLLFFQSGNEGSMNGWTSTWAGGIGASPRAATWVLAIFQATMMLGRVVAARLLRRLGKPCLVLISGAGAAAGCILMLLALSLPMMAVGVALTGLCFAPVYPTVLAMAGDRYPRFAGSVFGVLFSVGLVGGMLAPWSIGHISQRVGLRAGIAVPLLGAAMVVVMMAVIMRRKTTNN